MKVDRPRIVCLCGSTRFRAEYEKAFRDEEHAGRICLTVPCFKDVPCCKSAEDHARLDALHIHKIRLVDEVLVLNVGQPWCPNCQLHCFETDGRSRCCDHPVEMRGYIGQSTRNEIEYARSLGKLVRYLEAM